MHSVRSQTRKCHPVNPMARAVTRTICLSALHGLQVGEDRGGGGVRVLRGAASCPVRWLVGIYGLTADLGHFIETPELAVGWLSTGLRSI